MYGCKIEKILQKKRKPSQEPPASEMAFLRVSSDFYLIGITNF
jgi:hypothetical protein